MTNNTNTTPNITVEIIVLKGNFGAAFDQNSFLKWHQYAVEESGGDLKPITQDDIQSANYAMIASYQNSKKAGQCLLFNAASEAKRVQPYIPHLKEKNNTLILTSLSGRKAVPFILEEALSSSIWAGQYICAKTKAENGFAKAAFKKTGFETEGPMKVSQENYQSYLYHGLNLPKIAQVAVPKSRTVSIQLAS